jgi:uncharacterized protein YkwD
MSNRKLTVQPRTIALFVLVAALLLTFAALRPAPGAASGGCPGAGGGPDTASTAAMRQATICLINHIRHQHGLGSVHSDNSLRKAAQGHSDDMVRRDYFSHDSPGGSSIQTRIGGSGYLHGAGSYLYGEIIGGGTSQGGSPKAVAVAWMHSAPHRAAILTGRFHDLGVGVSHGFPGRGNHGATFTVDFGSRH